MEFTPETLSDFEALFEEVQGKIRSFPGCHHVELCVDASLPHVYYTFSKWENADALEAYRTSELFTETWARTKKLFGGKPLAYSLIQEN